MKDHGLKLFGKIIQISTKDIELGLKVNGDIGNYNDDHNDNECTSSCDDFKQDKNKEYYKNTSTQKPHETEPQRSKKGCNSTVTENIKPISNDRESSSQYSHSNYAIDQTSSSNSHDRKPLQKPDKILPCPRCNSMTTKFCYFNNYNVNQPRHFCKDCQRYWTAGGTMRNVPVGAGRRKSKSSASSQHHHFVPDSYKSYGFVQQNVNTNSILFDNRGNAVIPHGLSRQLPWQSGFFPVSICSPSAGNWNLETLSSSESPSSRKHSRDGKSENTRIVFPKTCNVDDPIEAANSSIWNTLHLKKTNHTNPPTAKGGFFGGLQKFDSNGYRERKSNPSGEASSMALEFNTAAFSRSLSFHETAR